jgi:hypothetical protein
MAEATVIPDTDPRRRRDTAATRALEDEPSENKLRP